MTLYCLFKHPTGRILDAFCRNPKTELDIWQVCATSTMPIRTVQRYLPKLVKEGLIIRRKTFQKCFYKLNEKSERAMTLAAISNYPGSE